jgi:hypothetical protein
MRITVVLAIACSLLASVCRAERLPLPPTGHPSAIYSVTQLRQIKIGHLPPRVNAFARPGLTLETRTGTTTQPNPAYTTGKGVVLSPINMQDTTGSILSLSKADYYQKTLQDIAQKDPNTAVRIEISSCSNMSPHRVLSAWFVGLAPEAHSYMLTLRIVGEPILGDPLKDSLIVYAGDTKFTGNDVLISPNTGEWRMTFNYAAGSNGYINVDTDWRDSVPTRESWVLFYYVQLAQLD